MSAPIVTVTVTGFSGNAAPNGTWTMPVPNPDGTMFGVFLVKLLPADQGWKLEVFRRCCGGRLKLSAMAGIAGLGTTFEVIGDSEFKGQKGVGSAV